MLLKYFVSSTVLPGFVDEFQVERECLTGLLVDADVLQFFGRGFHATAGIGRGGAAIATDAIGDERQGEDGGETNDHYFCVAAALSARLSAARRCCIASSIGIATRFLSLSTQRYVLMFVSCCAA